MDRTVKWWLIRNRFGNRINILNILKTSWIFRLIPITKGMNGYLIISHRFNFNFNLEFVILFYRHFQMFQHSLLC